MAIDRLDIQSIRNISSARLDPLGQVNIFHGANGSGKTSVLEAVHMLCLGRSFRTRQMRSVIQDDADGATVFGSISDEKSAGVKKVGVSRSRTQAAQIRIDGEQIRSLASLAELLPVQLLNADSFGLIEGGPALRRQFLDWGVFHVEHRFLERWQALKKCIKHRNSLLRHGKIQLSSLAAWDKELASHGTRVDASRKQYLTDYQAIFQPIVTRICGINDVVLDYRRGWPEEQELLEALSEHRARDIQQGFSGTGPHRADIKIRIGGKAANEVLSRGQEKILVCALRLAQALMLKVEEERGCLFLIDDLPSELDADHRRRLCMELEALQAQCFITCIEPGELGSIWSPEIPVAMFHVEHGQIKLYQV
ncbi:MAG: DNA replication/repair protein RecF [Pseudomonadota bacterium]